MSAESAGALSAREFTKPTAWNIPTMPPIARLPSIARMHPRPASPRPFFEVIESDSPPMSAAPLVVLAIGMGRPVAETTRRLLASFVTIQAIGQGPEPAHEQSGAAAHPHVVLLKADARRGDAADAVGRIAAQWRPVPVLVVTECEERVLNRRLVVAVRGR